LASAWRLRHGVCGYCPGTAAILPAAAFGPVRLPDLTGIPDLVRHRRRRHAAAVDAARALPPRLAANSPSIQRISISYCLFSYH
jgi:hypothetical protein